MAKYRFVYQVTKVHDPSSTNLKEGDFLFWKNVGEEYTILVVDKKGGMRPLADIKLIAILPKAKDLEEKYRIFLNALKKFCRKSREGER